MAYSNKQWSLVKSYYEVGLSLSDIVSRDNVEIKSKSQISKRANKEGWIKSEEKKQLINNEIEAKQTLNIIKETKETLKETDLKVHDLIVNETLKHREFFDNNTIKNLSIMMGKVGKGLTISEHAQAQNALAKGKEVILGREAQTQVNIQNNTSSATIVIPNDPVEASRAYMQMINDAT